MSVLHGAAGGYGAPLVLRLGRDPGRIEEVVAPGAPVPCRAAALGPEVACGAQARRGKLGGGGERRVHGGLVSWKPKASESRSST